MSDCAACTYCGEVANDVGPGEHGSMVPACQECNSLLGDQDVFPFNYRAGLLARMLGERYVKLIKSPVWLAVGGEELGTDIHAAVETFAHHKIVVNRRIAHCLLQAGVATPSQAFAGGSSRGAHRRTTAEEQTNV